LVNDQRDAQLYSMYLFIFLTLHIFRAHRADHQERQIVSIQPLVAVGGRVVCRSEVGRILLELTVWYAGAYAPAYQTLIGCTKIMELTRLGKFLYQTYEENSTEI